MTKLVDATYLTPDELATVPTQKLKLKTLRQLSNAALMNAAGALRAYSNALNESKSVYTDEEIWNAMLSSDEPRDALESLIFQAVQSVEQEMRRGLPERARVAFEEDKATFEAAGVTREAFIAQVESSYDSGRIAREARNFEKQRDKVYSELQAGTFTQNLATRSQADARQARELADTLTDAVQRLT